MEIHTTKVYDKDSKPKTRPKTVVYGRLTTRRYKAAGCISMLKQNRVECRVCQVGVAFYPDESDEHTGLF